ncbi:MAG: YHS domain-containing protein [Thermodesulfobacteriota bacterium]|nr:YHS domain-containing protein [Thermodesulfobacteriota bacterium]
MRLLIFIILAYLLYSVLKKFLGSSKEINRGRGGGVIDEMVQDPVCKTYIPHREAVKRVIEGQEFFFCSNECASKFESEMKK